MAQVGLLKFTAMPEREQQPARQPLSAAAKAGRRIREKAARQRKAAARRTPRAIIPKHPQKLDARQKSARFKLFLAILKYTFKRNLSTIPICSLLLFPQFVASIVPLVSILTKRFKGFSNCNRGLQRQDCSRSTLVEEGLDRPTFADTEEEVWGSS